MVEECANDILADIQAYYSSPAVHVFADRTALMLRATGEPWSIDEIAEIKQNTHGTLSYGELKRIVARKYPEELFGADGQRSQRALVDDYGNVINLTVAECREVVEAFKAIVHMRMAAGEAVQEGVIPLQYFRAVLTSLGDRLPIHYMELLLSQLQVYHDNVSLRALLKLLSRKM